MTNTFGKHISTVHSLWQKKMWKQETRRTETKIKQGDFLQWCARYRVSQLQPQIIFQGPTMQRPTTIWARKTATLKNTALPAKGWKMLCSCSTLAIHRKCRSSVLSSRTKVVDLVMRCGCRKKKKSSETCWKSPMSKQRALLPNSTKHKGEMLAVTKWN